MKQFLVAALCLAAMACSTNPSKPLTTNGTFRLIGWFYADAVVVDTDPGEEPETIYEGRVSYMVTHDERGGHQYFGVLCGPTDENLVCAPEPVTQLPFGPSYPYTQAITGDADTTTANFHIVSTFDGESFERDWTITAVSTEPPATHAINTTPPKLRHTVYEIAEKYNAARNGSP